MSDHVLALDQGTTSTRAIVFDAHGGIVAVAQREHEQIFPRAGWVEHDPIEIWTNTQWVIAAALDEAGLGAARLRRGRDHQPARDRDRLGSPHRPAGRQRPRLAGHPHPAAHRPARRRRRHRPVRRSDRPAAGDLLLGIQDRVDPRQRAGRASGCRSRAPPVRDARDVADLESHRRHARRHPCHRCHQREPHAADGPRAPSTGRTSCWRCSASRGRCCPRSSRRPVSSARCTSRRRRAASRSRASSATSRPRRSGRRRSIPASRRTPTARATSCWSTREPRSCAPSTAWSRPWRTGAATSPRATRWRARSR